MHASNGDVGRRRCRATAPLATTRVVPATKRKRLAIEPDAAGQFHGVLDHADADAPIVIAADCPDEARSASGGNQIGQLRQSALFVDKIAAEQEQLGVRGCDDPLQLIAKMFGFALPKMQIAHVEHAKRTVYVRQTDPLAADVGRFVRSDLNLPGKSHLCSIFRWFNIEDWPAATPSPALSIASCFACPRRARLLSNLTRRKTAYTHGANGQNVHFRLGAAARYVAAAVSTFCARAEVGDAAFRLSRALQQLGCCKGWKARTPVSAPVEQIVANLDEHHQGEEVRKTCFFGPRIPAIVQSRRRSVGRRRLRPAPTGKSGLPSSR